MKTFRTVYILQTANEYMVEMALFNFQKAITPCKPKVRFMCSARCHIVLYFWLKFDENISDSIRVMEWTRMTEALTDGRSYVQAFIGIFFV